MTSQPPAPSKPPPTQQKSDDRKRRWLPLLFLLLVPLCLWAASQLALLALGINEAHESLLSKLSAPYGTWEPGGFSALDPALIGTIRADQATFAASIGGSGGGVIVPYLTGQAFDVLTQISALSSPTPAPRPTSLPTTEPPNTPIVIVFPPATEVTQATESVPTETVTEIVPTSQPTTQPPPPPPPPPPPAPTKNADLAITKTDGTTLYKPGGTTTYTITVTNNGPDDVTNATVKDKFPGLITGTSWTCAASPGSSCPASGSGNLNTNVSLLNGGSATFKVIATISASAKKSLINTATVTPPSDTADAIAANNSATDIDHYVVITVDWTSSDTYADIDLWVYDPGAPDPLANAFGGSTSGGTLSSGDQNCGSPVGLSDQEEVLWNLSGNGPPAGTYDVYLFYYQTCAFGANNTVSWTITVTVDGVSTSVTGSHSGQVLNPPLSTSGVQDQDCPGTQLFPTGSLFPDALANCTFVPADPRSDGNPNPTFIFTVP